MKMTLLSHLLVSLKWLQKKRLQLNLKIAKKVVRKVALGMSLGMKNLMAKAQSLANNKSNPALIECRVEFL